MTHGSEGRQKAVKEGNAEVIALPGINAQARARARESTPQSASVAFDAVTQGAQAAKRAVAAAAARLDRPSSLFDGRPPLTFEQARAWHRECASHYDAALIRVPRLVWGYVHLLLVMPALRFAEYVTASPARLLVAFAVAAVIWIWI